MKIVVAMFIGGFILGACASAPEMQRASGPRANGYSEQAIEANRYRIDYRQDGAGAAKAQDFALLRAAELTLEKGHTTFEVVSRNSDTETRRSTEAGFATERDIAFTRSCGFIACRTEAAPVYRDRLVEQPVETRGAKTVSLEILMSDAPAAGRANAYDAAAVARSLRARG